MNAEHLMNADNLMNPEPVSTVLKPMPLWQSMILFTVPGIVIGLLYVFYFPYLLEKGFTHMEAMIASSFFGLAPLLVLALILYRREGNLFNWRSFKTRMRLKKMDRRAWVYTVLGLLFGIGTYLGLLFTGQFFADHFELPTWAMQPQNPPSIVGVYSLIFLRFGLLLVNVFGEELLWRGYILPRQELQHGRNAWWIHGLQWTWFHVLFKPWELFMLLPGCLVYPWICSKTQNTMPAIIMHLALNGLGVVLVTLGVLGVVG